MLLFLFTPSFEQVLPQHRQALRGIGRGGWVLYLWQGSELEHYKQWCVRSGDDSPPAHNHVTIDNIFVQKQTVSL